MRIIPNQFEKRFVSRLMKNGKKSIRFNPDEPKPIRIHPRSDWFKMNFQSESIRMNSSSDWFGLKTWFRIHSDSCLALNRVRSNRFLPFFIKRDTKRFSDLFGMIRIGLDTDIGIVFIGSEWIPIRYFCQGGINSIESIGLSRIF